MSYSYDYYVKTCLMLKKNGFYPKRILDIGANVCQTADIMREVWPTADIMLFEGNENVEPLYIQKRFNYQIKLLGSYNGFVNFYSTKWSPICSGNSIYREKSDTYNDENVIVEKKPIYKLDDSVVGIYDMIKIDTQGSELDIINGGLETFSKAKVVIAEVSLIDYNEGGCTKQQIIDKLTELKFDFISIIESVLKNNTETIAESLFFIRP